MSRLMPLLSDGSRSARRPRSGRARCCAATTATSRSAPAPRCRTARSCTAPRSWPTIIGDDCVVGHNAHLEGCVVEPGCLIGSGSVTLNRVVVGRGSIVAAGRGARRGLHRPGRVAGGRRARHDQAVGRGHHAGPSAPCRTTSRPPGTTGPACAASARRSSASSSERLASGRAAARAPPAPPGSAPRAAGAAG